MIKTKIKENELSNELTISSRAYQKFSRIFTNVFPYLPSQGRYNITICNDKKFVWFRVAKVGTRTIFDVLQKANLSLDAEHAMSCHYPINDYKNYFKFAFIRNPWDRLVSCWKNKVIDENHFHFSQEELLKMQKFENFVNFVSEQNISKCNHHLRLQSKLIDMNNLDYLGRFENFREHLKGIMKIIGIPDIKISRINESKDRNGYMSYYDEQLIQKVAEIYSRDINLFSYDFA